MFLCQGQWHDIHWHKALSLGPWATSEVSAGIGKVSAWCLNLQAATSTLEYMLSSTRQCSRACPARASGRTESHPLHLANECLGKQF